MADDRPPRSLAYRFFWLFAVVVVGCLLFLLMDVKHRAGGYRAVHHGITGTATITKCGSGWSGVSCRGDFVSADGGTHRDGIRINGAPQALHWGHGQVTLPARVEAAVGSGKSGEGWTLTGTPYLNLSKAQTYALVPVLAGVFVFWLLLRPGYRAARTVTSKRH